MRPQSELEDIPETQIDPQTRKEIKQEKAHAARTFDTLSLRLMESLQTRERDTRDRLMDVSQCKAWSAAAPHPADIPRPTFSRKRHREEPLLGTQRNCVQRPKTGRENPSRKPDDREKHCLVELENMKVKRREDEERWKTAAEPMCNIKGASWFCVDCGAGQPASRKIMNHGAEFAYSRNLSRSCDGVDQSL